jgi:hypothetical protein
LPAHGCHNGCVKLTPRQLVVRGRELAALLLRSLERDRLVSRFVDTYAVEFERACCTAYAGQYRETVSNIRRESLLAMTVWMEQELPQFVLPATGRNPRPRGRSSVRKPGADPKKTVKAAKKKPILSPQMQESLNAVYDEFLAALAQAMEWPSREIEEFRRDLGLYHKLMAGKPSARAQCPAGKQLAAHVEGPFVDRCGVLLDPSMLDKSRLAASRFQNQLHIATQSALNQVFSSRREN